jgi:hypothetical protein
MGDKEAMTKLIAQLDAATSPEERYNVLYWLAYTRQPRAIAALVRYLHSEEKYPSLSVPMPGEKGVDNPPPMLTAAYALYHLTLITENFPLDEKGYSIFFGAVGKVKQAREKIAQFDLSKIKIIR